MNFSISLSNEYSGLISFRIDWFDLLSVQGTLRSLLQHHNSKASILWCSSFMVQLYFFFLNYTWKSLLIHYVLHMWQTNTPLNFQNFCLITFFQNIWVLLICSKLFQTVRNEANIYETEVSRTSLGPRALFMFYSFLYRWLL